MFTRKKYELSTMFSLFTAISPGPRIWYIAGAQLIESANEKV